MRVEGVGLRLGEPSSLLGWRLTPPPPESSAQKDAPARLLYYGGGGEAIKGGHNLEVLRPGPGQLPVQLRDQTSDGRRARRLGHRLGEGAGGCQTLGGKAGGGI